MTVSSRYYRRIAIALTGIALVLCFSRFAAAAEQASAPRLDSPSPRFKASTNAADADACRDQLQLIHGAISAFTNAHQRLPKWLSELSPKYLDTRRLVCPYVNKVGNLASFRFEIRDDVFQDPAESTSYAYEFCDKQMILWTGVKKTWREYKQRLIERMGAGAEDAVPIVRCFAHDRVLNVTYSGKIYASGTDWEDLYPRFVHEDLHPEPLFFHERPRTGAKPFPPRAENANARMIDLSSYYNAYLDEPWLRHPRDRDLKRLPQGLQDFGDVRFDVRGLIQLTTPGLLSPYPVIVKVGIDQDCTKIHFLHAVRTVYQHDGRAIKVEDGTKIAAYVVHYRSGAQVEIPILYGRDIKEAWYGRDVVNHKGAQAVWEGENAESVATGHRIRVFLTSWPNPWKEQSIEALSLVSAMVESAPFILAITVE